MPARRRFVAQLARALALIAPAACLLFGQAPQAPPATLHFETDQVLVTFNVIRGIYFAPDVKPEDVVLLEDGKPRDFTVFQGPGKGRPPLELALLFDTTTLPPPESKTIVSRTHWDRKATYDFTNDWDDTMSAAVLGKEGTDVRVSVYRYDHQQLQRLCRSSSDLPTLTGAIHRLSEPMPGDEAVALKLPKDRRAIPQFNPKVLIWPLSWTQEAIIGTLKDATAAPNNATGALIIFSEMLGPTTTTAQDVADQANAFGVPVYPVVLDLDEYLRHPVARGKGPDLSVEYMHRFGSLGELTGGRSFYPVRIGAGAVNDILNEIRDQGLSRYIVGFAPPAGQQRTHTLEIKVTSKSSGKLVGGKRTAVY
jgi:hypothetical protein